MRYVYSDSSYIAHLWAHQSQEEARNSNGSFFFEGDTIYSYGHHFPCGKIVHNRHGKKAYVLNSNSYSVATSRHQGMVWGAIPVGALVFEVADCNCPDIYTINDKQYHSYYSAAIKAVFGYLTQISELLNKQRRARVYDYTNEIARLANQMFVYISFWDLDKRQKWREGIRPQLSVYIDRHWRDIQLITNKNTEMLARLVAVYKEFAKQTYWSAEDVLAKIIYNMSEEARSLLSKMLLADKRRQGAERKCYMSKITDQLVAWHNYEREYWGIEYADIMKNMWKHPWDTALRCNKDQIETSKGISLSITEGKRLWLLVESFHSGHEFRHDLALDVNGRKWRIDKYKDDVLYAGCHKIPYSECLRIAKQLKWI